MRKLEKQALRQRGRELRALLNEWDPIGVGPDGPKDEYDCLLWSVMRQLEADASPEKLTSFLAAELEEHFGHSGGAEGIASFVTRARAWFDTSWKGTRV
jgi:hypothetical protein